MVRTARSSAVGRWSERDAAFSLLRQWEAVEAGAAVNNPSSIVKPPAWARLCLSVCILGFSPYRDPPVQLKEQRTERFCCVNCN
jgi:hypothetical protein